MILGIDISTFIEQKKIANSKYYKNGIEIDPIQEFKNNGGTHIRLRVWNNPYDNLGNPYLAGTCDINRVIETIEMLKKYDFHYVIDFHYSDFWADPSKQFLPKAWEKLSFEKVVEQIYSFTKECLIKLKNINALVDMVQIGNEITHGMCWPLGEVRNNNQDSYDRLAKMLKSGIKASKEIYPKAKIILHLEESYNQNLYREYLTNLKKRNVEIDVLGSSYYPFWHHSFEEYFANMDMVQKEFNIPVINAELGFPFTLFDYKKEKDGSNKVLVINANSKEEFEKMMPYPCSKEGQKQFVRKFISLAKEHNLAGVFYWEPFWIPGDGICWASEAGLKYMNENATDTRNNWANQCLFDYEGNMLPSFEEFKL